MEETALLFPLAKRERIEGWIANNMRRRVRDGPEKSCSLRCWLAAQSTNAPQALDTIAAENACVR
jgi:hypothetical protein